MTEAGPVLATWLVPMVWRAPKRRTVDLHALAIAATSAREAEKEADDHMFLTYFFRVPELPVVLWHHELGVYNGPQRVKEKDLLSLREGITWSAASP